MWNLLAQAEAGRIARDGNVIGGQGGAPPLTAAERQSLKQKLDADPHPLPLAPDMPAPQPIEDEASLRELPGIGSPLKVKFPGGGKPTQAGQAGQGASGKPPSGQVGGPAPVPQQEDISLESVEALIRMAGDRDENVRIRADQSLQHVAASSGNAEVLERLSALDNSHFNGVLQSLAGNAHAPEDVLRRLASDGDHFVVAVLAGNRHAPADALDGLVRSPSVHGTQRERQLLAEAVREAVAGNPGLLPQTYDFLAAQGNATVRKLVAGNQGAPVGVLERLARDADAAVSQAALAELARRAGGAQPQGGKKH